MVSFTTLLSACALVTGAFALPGNSTTRRSGTGNSSGTNNGFYYQFWSNGGGNVVYTNGNAGSYSIQWSNVGDFTAGKGWNPGGTSPIAFSGSYNPGSSGGSLAVYGWSTNPLVEYYVMEDFPSPPTYGLTQVGTLTSDGSSYTFYKHQQVNQPSIVSSSSTFMQYISIRASPRTSGTVTVANHFNAWAKAGLNLGTMNYQIISVESYGGGSGSASITVSQGSSTPSSSSVSSVSTQPGTTSSATSPVTSPTGACSAMYGQCGGSGWAGATCCSAGTCKYSNDWYSQCL